MKNIIFLLFTLSSAFFANAQSLIQVGDSCFKNSDYVCAEANYIKAVKLAKGREKLIIEIRIARTKDCKLHLTTADKAFANKNYHLAKENYASILDTNPNDIYAKNQLTICNDLNIEGNDEEITLSVSQNDLTFPPDGGKSGKISVISNATSYTISQIPIWFSVETFNGYIIVSCSNNITERSRAESFLIIAESKTLKINVSQSSTHQKEETTSNNVNNNLLFSPSGKKSQRILINSNERIELSLLPTWCSVATFSGYFEVTCAENLLDLSRNGSFIATAGNETFKINIKQLRKPRPRLNPNPIGFDATKQELLNKGKRAIYFNQINEIIRKAKVSFPNDQNLVIQLVKYKDAIKNKFWTQIVAEVQNSDNLAKVNYNLSLLNRIPNNFYRNKLIIEKKRVIIQLAKKCVSPDCIEEFKRMALKLAPNDLQFITAIDGINTDIKGGANCTILGSRFTFLYNNAIRLCENNEDQSLSEFNQVTEYLDSIKNSVCFKSIVPEDFEVQKNNCFEKFSKINIENRNKNKYEKLIDEANKLITLKNFSGALNKFKNAKNIECNNCDSLICNEKIDYCIKMIDSDPKIQNYKQFHFVSNYIDGLSKFDAAQKYTFSTDTTKYLESKALFDSALVYSINCSICAEKFIVDTQNKLKEIDKILQPAPFDCNRLDVILKVADEMFEKSECNYTDARLKYLDWLELSRKLKTCNNIEKNKDHIMAQINRCKDRNDLMNRKNTLFAKEKKQFEKNKNNWSLKRFTTLVGGLGLIGYSGYQNYKWYLEKSNLNKLTSGTSAYLTQYSLLQKLKSKEKYAIGAAIGGLGSFYIFKRLNKYKPTPLKEPDCFKFNLSTNSMGISLTYTFK